MRGAVFHRLDHAATVARLRAYAREELGSQPEVREVVLIGSLARGDWSARSDADLVVLVDRAEDPGPFRSARYAPAKHPGIPGDLLVDTPDEARAWPARFQAEVERNIRLHSR
jgi:hypothetical protein